MRFIPAPAALAPWVLGVTVLRTAQAHWLTVPAHALAVFTFVQRGALQLGPHRVCAGEAQAVFGQGSNSLAQPVLAHAGTVSVSLLCRASVLPWLAGEAADGLADASVAPGLVGLELDRLHVLLAPWRPDPPDSALAGALFTLIAERMHRARAPRPGALRFAEALAHWSPGAALRPPPGWADRQWQRACQVELGVTPKFLQRLNRLHTSVRVRLQRGAQPLAQHALQAGFFDQAHMAREYRLLAGVVPSERLSPEPGTASGLVLGASELVPRFHARHPD